MIPKEARLLLVKQLRKAAKLTQSAAWDDRYGLCSQKITCDAVFNYMSLNFAYGTGIGKISDIPRDDACILCLLLAAELED